MMSDDVKRIDIAEFRKRGFLQEVNRQFFHPLGLALEVVIEDECIVCGGSGKGPEPRRQDPTCGACNASGKRPPEEVEEQLGGIWDYRDDPEGILFGGDLTVDPSYVATVEAERKRHVKAREALLGEGQTVQVK